MIKELELLGLNRPEIDIYICLLKLGKASVGELAKKSKIKRTSIYDILNRLSLKGLINSALETGGQRYHPKNPKNLIEIIDEQEESLNKMLPRLVWISSNPKIKTKIKYFNTPETVNVTYEDTLKLKGDHLFMITPEFKNQNVDLGYLKKYIAKRVSKKIQISEIYQSDNKSPVSADNNKKALRSLKIVSNKYPIKAKVSIYGKNKVSFTSYLDETGVQIIDKNIYNTFESIFKTIWKSLPEYDDSDYHDVK